MPTLSHAKAAAAKAVETHGSSPRNLALPAGIHPKVVSERLGHAAISIILDTYSHASPAMQEEAVTLIAGPVSSGN